MICSNCKKEISKADKFCDYCGTKIILKENENEVKVERRSSKWPWIISGVFLLIVVNAFMGAIFNTPNVTPTRTLAPEPLIPAHFITYTDEMNLFSISYPPNWEIALWAIEDAKDIIKKIVKDADLNYFLERINIIFAAGVPIETGYSPSINIAIKPLSNTGLTLDEYVESSVWEIKSFTKKYREFSRTRTIIGGNEAIIIEYEADFPNMGRFHTYLMMMIVEDIAWVASCGSSMGKFNEHKNDCYAIIRSLRILR